MLKRSWFLVFFLVLVAAACSDGGPTGIEDEPDDVFWSALPNVNGLWVAETGFVPVSNSCNLPIANELLNAKGAQVYIDQDAYDRSRLVLGPNVGRLQLDGTFATDTATQSGSLSNFNGLHGTMWWSYRGQFDRLVDRVEIYGVSDVETVNRTCSVTLKILARRVSNSQAASAATSRPAVAGLLLR